MLLHIWKCIKSSPCAKTFFVFVEWQANKCDKKSWCLGRAHARTYIRFKYEIEGEKMLEILQRMTAVCEWAWSKQKIHNEMRWQKAATAAATRWIKMKKTNVFMRLGFILIGFFIRNLVKRNVKNGLKVQTQKRAREKNASSIIHQRSIYKYVCVYMKRCRAKLPNRNQQICIAIFCANVARLFIQYYFQKGCRCNRLNNNISCGYFISFGRWRAKEKEKIQICEHAYMQ